MTHLTEVTLAAVTLAVVTHLTVVTLAAVTHLAVVTLAVVTLAVATLAAVTLAALHNLLGPVGAIEHRLLLVGLIVTPEQKHCWLLLIPLAVLLLLAVVPPSLFPLRALLHLHAPLPG